MAGHDADAGATTEAGAAGEVAGSGPCPGTMGPLMVRVPEGYCIDSTEVTRDQYAAWLASNPAVADFPNADCEWNTDFVPASECMNSSWVCKGADCGDHPQVCSDWCDAWAFCKAAGKRLCGRIGGGSNVPGRDNDPESSQWFNVCSAHLQYKYPYGNDYDSTKCNTLDQGLNTTMPVASMPACQSIDPRYQGVFDLSGNIWEWEDSCDPAAHDYCATRGGAFYMDDPANACGYHAYTDPSNHGGGYIGFRCCAD
jgi:formylglycine-generating enzyme required for sulfatase activity